MDGGPGRGNGSAANCNGSAVTLGLPRSDQTVLIVLYAGVTRRTFLDVEVVRSRDLSLQLCHAGVTYLVQTDT